MTDVYDMETIREILQNLRRHYHKTILMAMAPIGTVYCADLEFLAEDIALLQSVGMTIYFALYPNGDLQQDDMLRTIGCEVITIQDLSMIVPVAVKLSASKICFLCGSDTIYTLYGSLNDLSIEQAEQTVKRNDLSSEVHETIKLAIQACRAGIPRVHLFNAHRPGALLQELLTNRGSGVMLFGESAPYKQVRHAEPKDSRAIIRLLQWLRQRESALGFLLNHIAEFRVFTVDNDVHGCARVLQHPDMLEVTSLAHTTRFDAAEILRSILEFVLKEARDQNVDKIIVPTNDLPPLMAIMPWFSQMNFHKEPGHPMLGRQKIWVKQLRDG